jgi:hypothetical protein
MDAKDGRKLAVSDQLSAIEGKIFIIEFCKSNGILRILLSPPHPPLSPGYGGEDKGEGVCGIPISVPLFMQKSIGFG